jgi:adenylate kinase
MVLGPAAAGKSTACDLLSTQFQLPHINVGDLLYEEIARKTPLGLEAKEFMDATKTVPDR